MTFDALVEAVQRDQAVAPCSMGTATLLDALTTLFQQKFTGRIWVDFAEGRPKGISVPNPVSIKLVDSPRRSGAP